MYGTLICTLSVLVLISLCSVFKDYQPFIYFQSLVLLNPVRLFSASSVEGIVKNLKTDGSEFAKKQTEVRCSSAAQFK